MILIYFLSQSKGSPLGTLSGRPIFPQILSVPVRACMNDTSSETSSSYITDLQTLVASLENQLIKQAENYESMEFFSSTFTLRTGSTTFMVLAETLTFAASLPDVAETAIKTEILKISIDKTICI